MKINLRFAIKNGGGRFRPKNRVPWYPLELKKCRTRRLGFHKVSLLPIYLTFWGFWGGSIFDTFFDQFFMISILSLFDFFTFLILLIFEFFDFVDF